MDNLLLYLLKVSAGTALFYLCYLLLFSKDTFYLRNRILLILTLLLPTILPAIRIPVLSDSVVPVESASVIDNIIFPEAVSETTVSGTVNSFDFNRLFVWIYFTIAGLLLLRGVVSLITTFRIIKTGSVKNNQFPKVIISENKLPPFSFFPYVVIPAEDYEGGNYNDILDHESAHIKQGHTFDLLLSELFIAFQWFNPFVWLVKRSIILNHEYLADHISLSHNNSVREYQFRLLNFQTGLRNISLAHNFNSLIKNRIIMINKKPTRKYAALKNILILPVAAIVAYAFATPEYHYVTPSTDPLTIKQASAIIQKEVKGIVLNEDGKPFEGVHIMTTGKMGEARGGTTGKDGLFSITDVPDDASLLFFYRGYKQLTLKPDFSSEMTVRMVKDPEYKAPAPTETKPQPQRPEPLVVVDGVIVEKSFNDVRKELAYDFGIMKSLSVNNASEKYGDKGKNGAVEITTRKKAIEMGLKPPFPRLKPEDYPTFQGNTRSAFNDWVLSQLKYPPEASAKGIQGVVSIGFSVELDGSITDIKPDGTSDPVLAEAVINIIRSSPKWDPPENTSVDAPFQTFTYVRFTLPDKISGDVPFVVVEEMPQYPGGDAELLNFIKNNAKYPEEAKSKKIEGRVIIRFVVNPEGNVEDLRVLKGVDPLLDAEALRVVRMLNGWKPGMQGGKAVGVYYMVPVTFALPQTSSPK
jgi:TonB family protein